VPPARIWLGLVIGAAAVFLAARELSLYDVAGALSGIRPGWLLAALAAAFIGQFIKAYRWRVMLSTEPHPPDLLTTWVFHLTGQLGNILIPGPAGDVGRIVVLGGRGQGRMFTFGTVALEKLMDLAGFALLVLLVLARLPLPGWIENSAVFIVVLAAAAVIALWAGIRRRQRLSDLVDRLPGAAGERINRSLRAAAAGLRSLRLRSRIVLLVLTTALNWTASILVNHWLLAAFGVALPLSVSALLLVVLQIGVSTNLVPGTIGLFEFLCVETLALFDVPRDVALGCGLVLHLIVLTPPVTAVLVGAMGGFWVRGGRRR
jgi:uncharacterized protein (TIRG00374 family)